VIWGSQSSRVIDQQRGPIWSSPRPLKYIYCSSNLLYLHLGTSGLANEQSRLGSDVRSRALSHLSSGGCVLRESEAKKRLGFGTEKDCLLAEELFHQVLASEEGNLVSVF